jgi:hypothetical protein
MVWVRLAQPAQQAPLKSHKIPYKTITLRGDIRGEFVIWFYGLRKPIGPNRVPHINASRRIGAIPWTWDGNTDPNSNISGLAGYKKNE